MPKPRGKSYRGCAVAASKLRVTREGNSGDFSFMLALDGIDR